MARRGAMAKPPPLRGDARKEAQAKARGEAPPPQKEAKQEGVPTRADNLALYNAMTPEQQARYRKIRANKGVTEANKFLNKAAPQPTAAPQQATPEEITEQGFRGSADLYGGMIDEFRDFDPYQAQSRYDPIYSQEMDRARQNIMGQFERRNAEEFERQNVDTQRQIVERGLDPNSPAAQALMKQNTQRQDLARQEAMSAAEQAADARQQQLYGQAMGTAGMRYDIYGSTFAPVYGAGIGAQYQQQQLTQQQQFEARQAELERRNRLQMARMSRGGGGGAAGPTLYERMEAGALGQGYGQQQQNPWANVAQGVATGATGAITNWALK